MAESFGQYQLHEKIAQGGMAEVFVATREGQIGGFRRQLAIKRMFPHLVDQEEVINMFIDEARIASRLNHPNIVQIYDLGVVDETFFIAMEYVEGLDLRRVCELGVDQRNFLPRPLAVHIIAEAAAGLYYAHTRVDENGRPMNVVHRDISPQNLLISVDGAVKICDFGIAKAESRLSHTRAGEFKGKFSYMSPEQFGHGSVDNRSDIFTLGIVLYETTVATRLFRSSSEYEAMRKITEGDFVAPSQVRPDYPSDLEDIVLKTLSVDADERYQSAEALREDLEDWLFEQRVRTGSRQVADYLSQLKRPPKKEKPSIGLAVLTPGEESQDELLRETLSNEPTYEQSNSEVEQPSEEMEDPTTQMSMTEEQLRAIDERTTVDGERNSRGAPDSSQITSAPPAMDPALDACVGEEDRTRDKLGAPRQPSPARAADSSADAVEIRRISAEEAQRRRYATGQTGALHEDDATIPDEEFDDQTTSPVVDSVDEVTDERRTPRPESDEPDEWDDVEDTIARDDLAPRVQPPSKVPDDAAPPERIDDRSDEQKSPATGYSTDSDAALDEMPDLNPGGRELTGLNEMRAGSSRPSNTEPMAAVKNSSSGGGVPDIITDNVALIAIASVVFLVLGLGAAALFFVFGGGQPEDSVDESDDSLVVASVGDDEVELYLDTEPDGASVVVNGILEDGKTPMTVPLVDGRDNEVWIIRQNRRPVRMLIPASGEPMERLIELERASTSDGVGVDFHSTPPGAQVYVNGEAVGEAPFRMENVRSDVTSHVQFEREGFRPYVVLADFTDRGNHRIQAVMTPSSEDIVPASYEFRPSGSRVFMAGEELGATPFEHSHRRDQWLELEIQGHERQTRQHRFRLDRIGGFELSMVLEQEQDQTGLLSVETESDAAVYFESRAFGAAPLERAELPVGEQIVVFETPQGERIRVPFGVEADAHRTYRVQLGGDEPVVEQLD